MSKSTDTVNRTTTSTPNLPRVGIVAVTIPGGNSALRPVWVSADTLIVGYDPALLTRDLVEHILHLQLGAYVDIDAEVTQ